MNLLLAVAVVLGNVADVRAGDADRFFETKIRPVLAEHCFSCHGASKQKGDLRLDSRESILKGGVSGPAFDAEHPERSLLLKAIHQRDPELKMPPRGKLADRHLADLTRWVAQGAHFPANAAVKKRDGRDHWAFRRITEPPLPAVKNAAWATSPLDRFVLASLEARGIPPAPTADRRTLLRRVTFDLLGLPPTPAEVDAFVADTSPDAFAKVVDRLLASPHYGERWARHWLDIARYADSNGLDENIAFGNAWRYRDYVVNAFNQDRPYDQFLLEQIAGDLLPDTTDTNRSERTVATGFLVLGPKVLAEGDQLKMELDIIDEQLDTCGKAILGLTLGCARCHDHKFDPITTRDYHGLVGIFKSTRTMESHRRVARWNERPLGSTEQIRRQLATEQEIKDKRKTLDGKLAAAKSKLQAKPGMEVPKDFEKLLPVETQKELQQLRDELTALEKISLPTAMSVTDAKVVDAPIYLRGDPLRPGKVVPRQVPVVLAGRTPTTFDAQHSGRLELARWLVRPEHPLTARVLVNRVWRWHFGQGIVPTPDNFGLLGEPPIHPALLDWLAMRFMADGWSLKALHRTILLSSTYRTGSLADAKALALDPENRLQGRASVRRLEAEAVRDNLLAVSGLLDRTMGGSLLTVKNRDYLFDHTSKDATKYDSNRRSIYLPVIRNNFYDVFQLFDFPDPAVAVGDRASTTVATQALFFLNSDLVARVCEHWAGTLLKDAALDDAGRVRQIYRTAFAREPSEAEYAAARTLLATLAKTLVTDVRPRLRAWGYLCQTVVSANEFVCVQ